MKKILLKSSCIKTLNTYIFFIKSILNTLNLKFSIFFLPKTEKKFTLLKSPHVFKEAKEQFSFKEYKVIVVLKDNISNENILNIFINKPTIISLKIKY